LQGKIRESREFAGNAPVAKATDVNGEKMPF
jgi:hypothetical protein